MIENKIKLTVITFSKSCLKKKVSVEKYKENSFFVMLILLKRNKSKTGLDLLFYKRNISVSLHTYIENITYILLFGKYQQKYVFVPICSTH